MEYLMEIVLHRMSVEKSINSHVMIFNENNKVFGTITNKAHYVSYELP